jgi:hypothetical protein
MSTITATAPTFETPRPVGRRVVIAGIAVVGLVTAGAIAIPRLTAQTATTSYPSVTQHDATEHQLDSSKAQALVNAERAQSAKVQRRLDLGAKSVAAAAAVPASMYGSQIRAQVGGMAPTFRYTPTTSTYAYVGSQLVQVNTTTGATSSALTSEQVGGGHGVYPFTGTRAHLTWSDAWVPPYDDPAWAPFIQAHYDHPTTTPARPTHEFR